MTITLNFTDRNVVTRITDGNIGLVRHGLVSVAFDLRDRYHAALQLVARIDRDLYHGNQFCKTFPDRTYRRRRTGALLTELDQVINAILQDDLVINRQGESL